MIRTYLESLIRCVLNVAKHKRRRVVFATDVLATASADRSEGSDAQTLKEVCGTGRVAQTHAKHAVVGGSSFDFVTQAAEYAAKLSRRAKTSEEDDLLDGCNPEGFVLRSHLCV